MIDASHFYFGSFPVFLLKTYKQFVLFVAKQSNKIGNCGYLVYRPKIKPSGYLSSPDQHLFAFCKTLPRPLQVSIQLNFLVFVVRKSLLKPCSVTRFDCRRVKGDWRVKRKLKRCFERSERRRMDQSRRCFLGAKLHLYFYSKAWGVLFL